MGFRHLLGYIEYLRHDKNLDLVALVDFNEKSSSFLSDHYYEHTGKRLDIFKNYNELITSNISLDSVDIATTNDTHHEISSWAMKQSLHVMCEKPVALSIKLANELIDEIQRFKKEKNIKRLVMVWCGSTEIFLKIENVHKSISAFEKGLKNNDKNISPSMIYAYAAIKSGAAYANGAPNLSADIPALISLSLKSKVPICGKDFKTGQTLMKTILAPGLKSRLLGLNGWFSTNILGNRDGEVLDNPKNFKTKEESKLSVLDHIFQSDLYPDLYGDFYHKVRINYYPPRGDEKEAWDNIDIFGWLNYPMQIKVNFLCRDSILAAPIVLDLIIFMDLALRSNMSGIQEWMSFYFKSPMHAENLYPEHDLFIQSLKLKNTLRVLAGEKTLDHTGLDYYYD